MKKKAGKELVPRARDAARMSRLSSSALSLRQSLGMPMRASFTSDEDRSLSRSRKSKISGGRSVRNHESSQRRVTLTGHGGSRRQTQVLSRPSTGRCV